jgi:hypothetical protein
MSDMLKPMGQPYLDDNIDMLVKIGAKFVGRAVLIWGQESLIPSLLSAAEPGVRRIHTADGEIIVQAAIFEIITTDVENVPVPEWVFHEFGLPVEQRNFDYHAMLPDDPDHIDFYGPGSSVPDISRLETRLWFFYLGVSYIDIGIEAIHLGQFGWVSSWLPGECPKEECVWGYDEMSWFGLVLNEGERNDFLSYVWEWVRTNDPVGNVEMPGMRDLQAEGETGIDWYFANSRQAMLYGYNQEETIKNIGPAISDKDQFMEA